MRGEAKRKGSKEGYTVPEEVSHGETPSHVWGVWGKGVCRSLQVNRNVGSTAAGGCSGQGVQRYRRGCRGSGESVRVAIPM